MATVTPDHEQLVATMTGGMARPDRFAPFEGSDRLRPDGRPRPEFRAELRRIPDARNAVTAVVALLTPVAIVWAAVTIDHPVAWVAAFLAMAAALNRMFILHHEGAHRLLFSNRRINDVVGILIFGWIAFGTGTDGYRRGHSNHHRDEFGPKEPDFLLYSFYPISPGSLRRKLTRDASGVSWWRITKPRFTDLLTGRRVVLSLRYFGMQAAVFAVFALAGHPWLYLFLWALPWMTLYQVMNRLRAIAEHGGMTRSSDRRLTTHQVKPSWVTRLTFLPCNVGYHLAHHVDSGVPYRNLPRLHDALLADGYLPADAMYPNYRTLWRDLIGR